MLSPYFMVQSLLFSSSVAVWGYNILYLWSSFSRCTFKPAVTLPTYWTFPGGHPSRASDETWLPTSLFTSPYRIPLACGVARYKPEVILGAEEKVRKRIWDRRLYWDAGSRWDKRKKKFWEETLTGWLHSFVYNHQAEDRQLAAGQKHLHRSIPFPR